MADGWGKADLRSRRVGWRNIVGTMIMKKSDLRSRRMEVGGGKMAYGRGKTDLRSRREVEGLRKAWGEKLTCEVGGVLRRREKWKDEGKA